MRTALFVILTAAAVGAAHAQAPSNKPAPIREPGPPQVVAPTTPPNSTVVVGTDQEKSGPGANATIARSGTGAATVMTDSAVGGNAEQQERGVPQAGGGGGGASGQ